jgi:lipopolysaccharide heptosyltransferase II
MEVDGRWSQVANLLCVRLDTLGDVLMTSPAIRALRESAPGRRVTLLTSPAGAAAAALVPEIDEVLVYDAPWMKATAPRAGSRLDEAMIRRLARQGFDAAVIFTVYSQNPLPSAMLCYLAGIPLRLAHCRENPYQLLTDWAPEPEPQQIVRHEVQRQLDLVASVGCEARDTRLSLRVPGTAYAHTIALLAHLDIDPRQPWVVIHPGASAPSRRYPPASFAAVARRLVEEHGLQVIFTGTEPERALIEDIRGAMDAPSHSLVGCLDLAQLSALIALAPLLISNNTGPVHIAAAAGTPVVVLYALTNPQHTPWQVPSRVLFNDVPCKYCYKSTCPLGHQNCLRLVPPEEVVRAAVELLAEARGSALPSGPTRLPEAML